MSAMGKNYTDFCKVRVAQLGCPSIESALAWQTALLPRGLASRKCSIHYKCGRKGLLAEMQLLLNEMHATTNTACRVRSKLCS